MGLENFLPEVDRFDIGRAREFFENTWPDLRKRSMAAQNLADSIKVANDASTDCWSLTMKANQLKLNVGPVETIWMTGEYLTLVFEEPVKVSSNLPFYLSERNTQSYSSVPVDSCLCDIPFDFEEKIPVALRSAHELFIRSAADRGKTRYKKSHSPSVLAFLEQFLGVPIPRPSYENSISKSNGLLMRHQTPDSLGAFTQAQESDLEALSLDSFFEPTSEEDARRRCFQSIVIRQGQPEFRRELLLAYEGKCAVTGCDVERTLEAAHIVPYNGGDSSVVSNGLLLRADIHTLFDFDMIGINPIDYSLSLAKELHSSCYGPLHGKVIFVPAEPKSKPSSDCLRLRWDNFLKAQESEVNS